MVSTQTIHHIFSGCGEVKHNFLSPGSVQYIYIQKSSPELDHGYEVHTVGFQTFFV